MAFGEQLKRLRETAGLSQASLAEAAGVPLRSIQNWEQGHRVPKAEALLALSQPLNVSLERLVGLLKSPATASAPASHGIAGRAGRPRKPPAGGPKSPPRKRS